MARFRSSLEQVRFANTSTTSFPTIMNLHSRQQEISNLLSYATHALLGYNTYIKCMNAKVCTKKYGNSVQVHIVAIGVEEPFTFFFFFATKMLTDTACGSEGGSTTTSSDDRFLYWICHPEDHQMSPSSFHYPCLIW